MGSDVDAGLGRYERDLFGDDDDDNVSIHTEDEDERRSDDGRKRKRSQKGSEDEDGDEKKDPKVKEVKKDKVKPKRQGPVKHVLLDEDTLCGKNGLIKIEEEFKSFKFFGKGHEQKDLDRILHKLEHWVHVLHPRFPFDQTLERIEFLGTKKPRVKTYVKKMRMGLISAKDKQDDFLNLETELTSDDGMDGAEESALQENSLLPEHQELLDEFPDDFPDIPDPEQEEMMSEENNT